jgi:hypothetical protein
MTSAHYLTTLFSCNRIKNWPRQMASCKKSCSGIHPSGRRLILMHAMRLILVGGAISIAAAWFLDLTQAFW